MCGRINTSQVSPDSCASLKGEEVAVVDDAPEGPGGQPFPSFVDDGKAFRDRGQGGRGVAEVGEVRGTRHGKPETVQTAAD